MHEHVSSNMHSALEQSYEDFGGKMPGLYEGVNLNKKTGHMPFENPHYNNESSNQGNNANFHFHKVIKSTQDA